MKHFKLSLFPYSDIFIIAGIVIAYIGLVVTGPVFFSVTIINYLPLVLLAASIYLSICNYLYPSNNNTICRLSELMRARSNNPVFWLALSFLLIGCQLVAIWGGEVLSFFYIGGLLPNGDASNYYKGARKLLLDGDLSVWSSRRPFMTVYLASILAISKMSLSTAVAVIAGISAFSIAIYSATLRRSESLPVAIWAFVLLFFFYYRLLGTTLSENLGLTLGCIAFIYLWLAADERNRKLLYFGLMFITLAQVTRSGAVLVLPALIIWGTFWLAAGARQRLVTFIFSCLSVAVGFLFNRLLLEMGGSGIETGFSNFSFTIYGLSAGHGGWTQISKDYPEIMALAEPARSQSIYALAYSNIINEPLKIMEAMFRNLQLYIFTNGGLNIVTGSKAWLLVQIPTVIGVAWCIRFIRTPRYAMLLFALAGILVSALLITEDGGLRVFAATVPFSAAIAAVGLAIVQRQYRINNAVPELFTKKLLLATHTLSFLIIIGITLVISIVPLDSMALSKQKNTCSPGSRMITISYPVRSAIHVRQYGQGYSRYVPDISVDEFHGSLKQNGRRRDWPKVNLLQMPYSLLSVGKYILLPTSSIIEDPPEITICTEKKGWLFIDQRLIQGPS